MTEPAKDFWARADRDLLARWPKDTSGAPEPAAKLDIQVPADGSIQLKLTTEDGTLLKQERGEGVYVDENDPASDVRWTHYFDTVPEDCRTVTVTVYDVTDYDAPDGYEILAEFTVPLA